MPSCGLSCAANGAEFQPQVGREDVGVVAALGLVVSRESPERATAYGGLVRSLVLCHSRRLSMAHPSLGRKEISNV